MNTKMHQTIIPHAIQTALKPPDQEDAARTSLQYACFQALHNQPCQTTPMAQTTIGQPSQAATQPQQIRYKLQQEPADNPSSPLSTPPRFVGRVLDPPGQAVNQISRKNRDTNVTSQRAIRTAQNHRPNQPAAPSASPRQARPIKSKLNELAKETSKQESVSKTANKITT